MSRNVRELRRAVILAAGRSRRLQSLSLNKPKPMIEVGGKPLLQWHLESCAHLGIEEVFINLHYLPEQIRDFVGDGSRWNLKVRYQLEPQLTGTSGAVKGFAPYLRGAPFLVLYGDNFCAFPLQETIAGHFDSTLSPAMSIVLFRLEKVSGSGVANLRGNGLVDSFLEKPAAGATTSHWVNAGVYVVEPSVLDLIPDGISDFGHDVIPLLVEKGLPVLGLKTVGMVYAVDTPELLRNVTAQLKV